MWSLKEYQYVFQFVLHLDPKEKFKILEIQEAPIDLNREALKLFSMQRIGKNFGGSMSRDC